MPIQNDDGFLRYNISGEAYTGPGSLPLDPLCNGFTIINTGNSTLLWKGDPIAPGNFKAIGGNYGEVFAGRLDVNYQAAVPQPLPRIDSCYVTQKFYQPGSTVYDKPNR
jgi:hypothetical protein